MKKHPLEEINWGIENEIKAYSQLFDFFFQEHGLRLINEEMDEIIKACDRFKKQFNEATKTETK